MPSLWDDGPLWNSVSIPTGWADYTPPFNIQKRRGSSTVFRIDDDFVLRTHAGVTVSLTYYVDGTTGDDGNTGADWDNALATLDTAFQKADVDRIEFKGLQDYITDFNPANISRNIEIVGADSTAQMDKGAGSWAFPWSADSATLYLENITFLDSVRIQNNSATGGQKCYFKDCTFTTMTSIGVDELIVWNCSFANGGDGHNMDERNGVQNNVVEYLCTFSGFAGDSTTQASTAHNNCKTVRIMCTYDNAEGQCIADVNGADAWLLGCVATNSDSGIGYHAGTGNMWLDGCKTGAGIGTYDLQNANGSTIYTRNFSGLKGTNDISGSLETY